MNMEKVLLLTVYVNCKYNQVTKEICLEVQACDQMYAHLSLQQLFKTFCFTTPNYYGYMRKGFWKYPKNT